MDLTRLRKQFPKAVGLIAKAHGVKAVEINVRIVGDDEMTLLHDTHSGILRTTDVLTFDQSSESGDAKAIQADIAVCADEAARRAAEFGHTMKRELLLYMIHGVLHCVGYDDRTTAGFKRMHAEEDRILAAIGVGATFAARKQTARTAPVPRRSANHRKAKRS